MNALLVFAFILLLLAVFCAGVGVGIGRRENAAERKKMAFSKVVALGVLALDGLTSTFTLAVCWLSIREGFSGSLPYLTSLIGALQAATAYVLGHYYKKATVENQKGGIVYDTAINSTPDA